MITQELLYRAVQAATKVAEGPQGSTENMVKAAIHVVVTDLRAMLYPELYPGYDPDHIYWDSFDEQQLAMLKQGLLDPAPFQWTAEIGEWCGDWAESLHQATLPETERR